MRVMLAALLLLLAGCADSPEPTTDSVAEIDPATEGNVTEPPLNITAPVAVLGANATNGTGPMIVVFNITAEGNSTEWLLDFGDGNQTTGQEFPATANHTYTPGLYLANLTVSGPGGNDTASILINVTAAAATALEAFSQTVSLDQPCPGCGDGGTLTCTWRAHGNGNAQDCAWIDFPDELAGQPFTLTGNGLDADLLFWTSCDNGPGAKFHGAGNEAGIVPEGAGCVLVWEQLDALITLNFEITPE